MHKSTTKAKVQNRKGQHLLRKIKINPFVVFTLLAGFLVGRLSLVFLGLVCIVLHELSHAICAIICGFSISSIEVLPIGALARIDGLFEVSPICEILIALAGPAMSLALGLISYYLYTYNSLYIFKILTTLNLSIATINLLPALPLDGGRVLRSILSHFVGVKSATIFSCMMGILIGIAMSSYSIIMAIQGDIAPTYIVFGLLLIVSSLSERKRAMFISIAQVTEKKETLMRQGSLNVSQIAVPTSIKLYTVVSRFKPRCYHMIVIVDDNMCPVGYMSEGEVVQALINKGSTIQIGQLLTRY